MQLELLEISKGRSTRRLGQVELDVVVVAQVAHVRVVGQQVLVSGRLSVTALAPQAAQTQ